MVVGAAERALRAAGYQSLCVPCSEVRLDRTISPRCGQAFRWREHRAAPLIPKVLGDTQASQVEPLLEPQEEQALAASPLGRAWSLCLSDRVVLLRQDDGITPHERGSSAAGQI